MEKILNTWVIDLKDSPHQNFYIFDRSIGTWA